MKHLFLLGLFQYLLLLPAHAQRETLADSTSVVAIPEPIPTYDTLQAIHQLFAVKRDDARYAVNVGLGTAGVGAVAALTVVSIIAVIGSVLHGSADPARVASFSLKLLSPGLLITTYGLTRRSRFNRRREDRITIAYQQGKQPPAFVLRLLRKKYTKQTR